MYYSFNPVDTTSSFVSYLFDVGSYSSICGLYCGYNSRALCGRSNRSISTGWGRRRFKYVLVGFNIICSNNICRDIRI